MVAIHDGENLSAQKINDNLNHTLLAPVAYNPTVGGATASAAGKFMRIGKLIVVEFTITLTGGATGPITMPTPSLMAANTSGGNNHGLGEAIAHDSSAGVDVRRGLTVVPAGSSSVAFVIDAAPDPTTTVKPGYPWAWAAGDTISGRFTYWEA